MSERSEAPRSGGRSAQPRTTRRSSRDAETTKGGARGTRRSEPAGNPSVGKQPADTRRSGIRSRGAQDAAPIDGATALSIEVTADPAPLPGRMRLWVAPPLPVRAPRAAFATAIIAVVLVGVVGILLVNTATVEQSFRLDSLRKEKTTLDQRQRDLERQIVDASGPGKLHAAANRLGLVQAEKPAVIWLPNGEIVGMPVPGKGPTAPTTDDGLRGNSTPSAAAGR